MKKIYFSIFIFVLSNTIWSQETVVISNEIKENAVPFMTLDELLVYVGCEEVEKNQIFNCFDLKLAEHIKKNFKYPKKALKEKIQGRVSVQFTINEEGFIVDIQTKGGDPILQTEALRIIRLVPKMTPGKFGGKFVRSKYICPIVFKL
jgi:TonB family protein